MFFVAVGVTGWASVPETPVKFVDSIGSGIESVDMEVSAGDGILAGIAGMLYVLAMVWIGAGQ